MPVGVTGIKAFSSAAAVAASAEFPREDAVEATRELVGHLEAFFGDGGKRSGSPPPDVPLPGSPLGALLLGGVTADELQWMAACLVNAGEDKRT